MRHRKIATPGLLAAAVALAPSAGAAPADDWLRATDSGWVLPDPAAETPASDTNLAIALFGIPVFQEGSAHINPSPGSGLLAIADGADSYAQTGGFLNTAIAIGDHATAVAAGAGNLSVAVGDHATAAFGSFLPPIPFALPVADGIFAFGDNARAGIVGGSFNIAGVFGDDSTATAGNGIFDAAAVFGDDSTAAAGENLDVGNSGSLSLAAVFGDLLNADATGGIFRLALEPLFSELGWS